ncbi:DUF4037 domain-containing protein [Terribacillus saccharophilus]|uniref:DUF4037 domain-containing protein n=1 Tax=Terribacillus saccharophilus TaxID=361277 RepID=UPI003981C078
MNLLDRGKEIISIYKSNPKVETAFIGGSVSRNWQDAFSDIEIFVLWKEAPNDQDRKKPISKLKGDIIDFFPYEDGEWSETYLSQGVKLEISNFLTATIDSVIDDVLLSFDTNAVKQCLLTAIHDGISLSDDCAMEKWKDKVKEYPDGLRTAMVEEHMHLGNKRNNRKALLCRQDWLMLYQTMIVVQSRIMGILFGLNRVFIHHPSYKWQRHTLQSM